VWKALQISQWAGRAASVAGRLENYQSQGKRQTISTQVAHEVDCGIDYRILCMYDNAT
jgi:hypothetical protein